MLSCGLEEILYISYIPDGIINDNTSARIWLPSSSAEGYSNDFTHFEIYYRIYISGEPFSGEINTSALRRQINATLDSDFQGLFNLTDKTNTSVNPSNLDTTFSNRRFFKLTLEESNIDNVLGRGSLGRTLDIQFPPNSGVRPVLMLGGGTATYTYTGIAGGQTYTLEITQNSYKLTVELTNGSKKSSTGTVENDIDGLYTLKPLNSNETFTATVSRNGLTELNGKITWTDNSQEDAPGALTGGTYTGPATYTYTGILSRQTYTLKITPGSSQDSYELTVGAKKSTGTVVETDINGVLTLKPLNSNETFTATVSRNGLAELDGTITWTDGTQEAAPSADNTYTLRRAVSGPSIIFKPVPDNLYFLNHADLFATENATNDINADVAINSQNIPESPRYTYVSMYIFAIGRDYLTTIYSQPTHLGIFRLAEAN